jgi:hypothetical protein
MSGWSVGEEREMRAVPEAHDWYGELDEPVVDLDEYRTWHQEVLRSLTMQIVDQMQRST